MSAPPLSGERPVSAGWRQRLTSRLMPAVRRRLLLFLVFLGLATGAGVAIRPHVRAWYHRRAARREVQRYHNPQAICHLLICRDIWPRDPETLLLSARTARRARVYHDSERLLQLYRKVRGRDDAYVFEQLLFDTECRVDEFATTCWKCVEEGRYDAALLMEALTRGYLRQYRLVQARRCLEHWQQEQPDNPQVYYLEGLFKLDYVHSASAAEDSYRRAVELDADHQEARMGLAVALMQDKNFEEAAEHFRRLRQDQPDNLRFQTALAESLEGLGESAEAGRLMDDVLAQQPEFAPALALHGQWALKNGNLTEAETSLRHALRYNPRDHHTRYSLALCLEKSGQEEEAQKQRKELQQLEKDLSRFTEIVTKDIIQRPNDPALHCTIGQMLLKTGQRDEGIHWLQSALKLDPRNTTAARQILADYLSRAKSKGTK